MCDPFVSCDSGRYWDRVVRILLVDDEPGILRALERLFRRRGHEVRTTDSGRAAIGLLDQFMPDVVISDFKMEGMNGAELLQLIAARAPAARRILLSGYADVDEFSGAVFVRKPYDPQALLRLCE